MTAIKRSWQSTKERALAGRSYRADAGVLDALVIGRTGPPRDASGLSQLKERDAHCQAREESRRAGKRQAAPFSKDKPKRDPKKPGRKPGSKYGRQAVRAIPVPDKTFEAPCPEQCPCGGKVERDLYLDIPPIQPETWKFSWPLQEPVASIAGFRRRSRWARCISGPGCSPSPRSMICGVSYDSAWDSGCWVSPWRAPIVSCHACQAHPRCLGGGAAGQPRRLRR